MIYEKVRISMCCAKSLQSCLTLCDPIDSSPSGSAIPGILQARTLECVAISFSNAWKLKVKVKEKSLSHVRLFSTPWIAAYQAPPSMGFSRQEYWSGVPLPSPVPVLITNKFLCLHWNPGQMHTGQWAAWGFWEKPPSGRCWFSFPQSCSPVSSDAISSLSLMNQDL